MQPLYFLYVLRLAEMYAGKLIQVGVHWIRGYDKDLEDKMTSSIFPFTANFAIAFAKLRKLLRKCTFGKREFLQLQ